jgi:hypothetical protein
MIIIFVVNATAENYTLKLSELLTHSCGIAPKTRWPNLEVKKTKSESVEKAGPIIS